VIWVAIASEVVLGKEFRSCRSCRSSGVQEFRSSGVQEFRSSGVREFGSSGVREFGSSGVREFGSSGWADFCFVEEFLRRIASRFFALF